MSQSGKKDKEFTPSILQRCYVNTYVNRLLDKDKQGKEHRITQKDLANQIGVHEVTVSKWKADPDFLEWFDEEVQLQMQGMRARLEAVAVANLNNFNFWKELAQKYGYTKPIEAEAEQETLIIDLSGDGSAQKEKEEKA